MKPLHFFLISILLLSFIQIHSQEWAPIGAEWRYQSIDDFTGTIRHYTMIRIDKDTVVAGQECRKYTVYNQPAGAETNVFRHIGLTYEHNDSIFYWIQGTFLLRYDFSSTTGDTITIPVSINTDSTDASSFRVVLDSISMVSIGANNVILEKYHTTYIDGDYLYYSGGYYRVLGSNHIWGGLFQLSDEPIAFGANNDLRCYQDAHHEIFRIDSNFSCGFPSVTLDLIDRNQLKLYPNPVESQVRIQYDVSLGGAKFRLLNQLGEVLMSGYLPKLNTEYKLEIHQFPKGFLFLEVQNENRVGVWKVVKT